MKTKTSNWFECKIRYEKTTENGLPKTVTETYTINAISFTEAEVRMAEYCIENAIKDLFISDIKRAAYKDVTFCAETEADTMWYKVKLQIITIRDNGKEQKVVVYHLVQATNINEARKAVDDMMRSTMEDYRIEAVVETKILDIVL